MIPIDEQSIQILPDNQSIVSSKRLNSQEVTERMRSSSIGQKGRNQTPRNLLNDRSISKQQLSLFSSQASKREDIESSSKLNQNLIDIVGK